MYFIVGLSNTDESCSCAHYHGYCGITAVGIPVLNFIPSVRLSVYFIDQCIAANRLNSARPVIKTHTSHTLYTATNF